MAPRVRPLQVGDLDALEALDLAYAAALGAERAVSRASVHYYQRSGHSFVAERPSPGEAAPVALGFALAHPSWSGAHAVVRLERLGVAGAPPDEAAEAATALAAAVVKSAYDAGVYRLEANVPAADAVARTALSATLFVPDAAVSYLRRLGSGALSGAAERGGGDVAEQAARDVEENYRQAGETVASGGEHDRS